MLHGARGIFTGSLPLPKQRQDVGDRACPVRRVAMLKQKCLHRQRSVCIIANRNERHHTQHGSLCIPGRTLLPLFQRDKRGSVITG